MSSDFDAATAAEQVLANAKDQPWYGDGVAMARVAEAYLVAACSMRGLTGGAPANAFVEGHRAAFEMWPTVREVVRFGFPYRRMAEAYAEGHLDITRAPWMLGFDEGYRALQRAGIAGAS